MNFLVDRKEAGAVTGTSRTQTFELQKQGKWLVVSTRAQKSWFCLEQVLVCHAVLHSLTELNDDEMHKYQQMILLARLHRTTSAV